MNKGVVIGVVIALLVLAGIGGGIWFATQPKVVTGPRVTTPATNPTPVTDQTPTSPDIVEDEEPTGPVKEFTVVGGPGFKFSPATITVKKGDTVRINFKSQGGVHDLVIDEFDVATSQLGEEEEEEVEFVASKTGTFEYYCSVGNHRQMGMVGKLVVQ